mmetsp:Transcript_32917/g.79989  ORF Transcript_32917/g.79989 Transcript_32917/m.79989 type:complete len:255 (+) Transcript_32917:1007-1771(+)
MVRLAQAVVPLREAGRQLDAARGGGDRMLRLPELQQRDGEVGAVHMVRGILLARLVIRRRRPLEVALFERRGAALLGGVRRLPHLFRRLALRLGCAGGRGRRGGWWRRILRGALRLRLPRDVLGQPRASGARLRRVRAAADHLAHVRERLLVPLECLQRKAATHQSLQVVGRLLEDARGVRHGLGVELQLAGARRAVVEAFGRQLLLCRRVAVQYPHCLCVFIHRQLVLPIAKQHVPFLSDAVCLLVSLQSFAI